MKSTTSLIGVLLVIAGILLIAYEGFISYTKPEQIAQIGNVHVIENQEKTVFISPIYGGIALLGGIVLLVVGRRK
ncbi:MAG: hypothetical protein WC748_02240 [Legionellales bacterium]|jgi:uncharacterized membrane protein